MRKFDKSISFSSLILIFIVSLVSIAATQALYRDVEKSNKGTFVVGTLDLSVEAGQGEVSDHFEVENIGSSDMLSGSKTWIIKNVGTLPGNLSMRIERLSNWEYGCNEPEGLEDTSCDDPGQNQGELGVYLQSDTYLINDQNEQLIVSTNFFQADAFGQLWDQNTGGNVIIPPKESRSIRMDWSMNYEDFINEIQGDSVEFDIVFELEQVGNGN
ncbi:hypothetical protein KKD03_04225 [Patescibacteria group bacterium]|nr:hypothetical protein [Patescibacteria group bacterium]